MEPDRTIPGGNEQGVPEVSVVVVSHRSNYIEGLLESFGPTVIGTHSAEIIVVHDYPLSDSRPGPAGVRWIRHNDRSIPAKRNTGIGAAAAAVIAFIDDDCKPLPGWIPAGLAHLRAHPELAGVEGKTVIGAPSSAGGSVGEFRRLERRGYRTNNIFYRKETLVRVGGFDERFTVQREDLDVAFSVMDCGGTIGYAENAMVEHAHRAGERWDLLKNCINRRFDPLLYRKHPRRYREHVGSPFTPTIGFLLAAHVMVVVVALGSPQAGVFFAGADVLFVGAAALRKHLAGGRVEPAQLLRETAAFGAAPLVLSGALIFGSLRFRRFLLF